METKAKRSQRFKPVKYQGWYTLGEVATLTGKDDSWLRRLEKEDRIPRARRVRRGALKVRLWSPEQVEEIQQILSGLRPGRPKGS